MGTSLAVVLTTLLGGRAFAERHGESPAKVVALHGWGRTRADWNATLQGYDALALDLPGFGATPAPDSGWSTSEYAEWVAECLDEVVGSGGDRPVLVGHSFGGRVAVRLAATNPELVRGIVLTGVPLLRPETTASKPALGFRAMRFLNKWHFISNDLMEKERRKRGSDDYRAAEGEMREVLVKAVNEDYGDALDEIASNGLPVAMVWGEHDTAATTAMAERGPGPDRRARRPGGRTRLGAPARRGAGRRPAQGDRRPGRTTMSATANVLVGLAISLLALASYLRWWRVAQREHYEPGRLVAMAVIWCRAQPVNVLALAAVVVLCLVGLTLPLVGLVGALVWLLWPPGTRPAAAVQGAGVDAARPAAGSDHRRAARRGDRLLPGLRRGGRAACRCWRCRSPRSRCWPRTRWRTTSAGATRSRPPRRSSRSRRGWWRSPAPTARPRPRTTRRT